MTIQIGTLNTEIAPHDTFRLQTMAASVLANRPSFRSVRAQLDGESVDIYTKYDRDDGEELLIVQGSRRREIFRPRDRDALGAIARAA